MVPSYRSRTGWCTRMLSKEELFSVWDVTPSLTIGLRDTDREELCQATVPLKILGVVLRNARDFIGTISHIGKGGLKCRATSDTMPIDQRNTKCARIGPHPFEGNTATSKFGPKAPDVDNHNLKAARADDADVPKWIWNDRIDAYLKGRVERGALDSALEVIREKLAHQWWVRSLVSSFWRWRMGSSKHALENASLEGRMEAIRRAMLSSWWEWDQGSRLHFWRWPEEYLEVARDGLKPKFKNTPPCWVKPQAIPTNIVKLGLMQDKVQKVRDRRYVSPGKVISLMNVFDVPKGADDIRLVYDGTKSRLNDNLWAPWFPLPMVESLLRSIDCTTWLGDNDIGEQFHNFCLHPQLQAYCGIDLTKLFPEQLEKGKAVMWERWNRAPMGVQTSPYQAAQGMIWWEELVRGSRLQAENPLRWDTIVLNLPGSDTYQASKPWVYKAQDDGSIACNFRAYVDDLRATGSMKDECWQVTRLIRSKASFAGIQDASRKRREVSQAPGAWAGSVVETDGVHVGLKISQERWDKTKTILSWIQSALSENEQAIPFKQLESNRGFLVLSQELIQQPSCISKGCTSLLTVGGKVGMMTAGQ